MNNLQSYEIISPFGKTEECALFTIDDISAPFTLHDITTVNQQYTLSFWVRADATGKLAINGAELSVSTAWERKSIVFEAADVDLDLHFVVVGSYYIYHPKLELGNKVTDWTRAPEDVEISVTNAQSTADTANDAATSAQNDIVNAKTYTHTVLSIDACDTLAMFNFVGHVEAGTLNTGTAIDSTTEVRSTDFMKITPGGSYTWTITDSSGNTVIPVTHFYTSEKGESFNYLNSQTSNVFTAPTSGDLYIYMKFAVAINPDDIASSSFSISVTDLENYEGEVYAGTLITLESFPSINALDYEWELTDTSIVKRSQELAEELNKLLYDETDGDINKLNIATKNAQDTADAAQEALSERSRYVQIIPSDPSISLVTTGDTNSSGTKLMLTDKKIAMYNNGDEGAYMGYVDADQPDRTGMSIDKTYLTELYPRAKDPNSTEEDKWVGSLCWIARTNGHLSLKVVK